MVGAINTGRDRRVGYVDSVYAGGTIARLMYKQVGKELRASERRGEVWVC